MYKSFLLITLLCFSIAATNRQKKTEAILLVAFGTTSESGTKAYANIENAVAKEFPGKEILWSYTSELVRERIEKKSGKKIPSVTGALEILQKKKVTHLSVQSLHVVAGQEYEQLTAEVRQFEASYPDTFAPIQIGRPLLDSKKDMEDVVSAVISELSAKRQEGEALVLLGHGHHHGVADLAYVATTYEFQKRDSLIVLGTVEGGVTFEGLKERLKAANVKTVWLAPFMVVAGVHTMEDLIGAKESLKADLESDGFLCNAYVKGLGEYDVIASLFTDHLKRSVEVQ